MKMLIPRVKSKRVKAVEVCFTTFSSRGKTKFICILHMKSLLANSRPGGRAVGRYHNLRGRESSNVKPFEGKLFAAKILREGAISPRPQPCYYHPAPLPPTFPSAPVPTVHGGWMAHGIIIIFPAAIIHTSKQVKSIKTMEFLVLILFSNMSNLILSKDMKS